MEALPVRRYNDGTTNSSVTDLMTEMRVPAHSTRSHFGRFDWNALKHELIECGVELDLGEGLSADPVPLRVLPPA